jgi:hypothetical protein
LLELTDYAIALSFGEPHGPLQVGDKTVRYLAPEAIAGDDRARSPRVSADVLESTQPTIPATSNNFTADTGSASVRMP